MSCKPTYKGVRYNSLEELYKANGVNEQQKQQAVQSYSEYVEQTGKRDIEGFREFVDKTIQKNQIENKKDISKENNYVSAPREINLDFSIFTELKDDIFINCRN
jgi:type III secretory pathway component EscR